MSDFGALGAPARRALANAGIGSLAALAKLRESDVAKLHGMGPKTMTLLRAKLKASGKDFKKGGPS